MGVIKPWAAGPGSGSPRPKGRRERMGNPRGVRREGTVKQYN